MDFMGPTPVRCLRPSLLLNVGVYVVALDDIHPYAAILDDRGTIRSTVSWEHLRGPDEFVWPPRMAWAGSDGFWVDDRANSDIVRVDFHEPTRPQARAVDTVPTSEVVGHVQDYRLARSSTLPADGSSTWQCDTLVDGTRWMSSVTWYPEHEPAQSSRWLLGTGSITSAVATPAALFLAIRRAPKRPWIYRPPAEVIRLTPNMQMCDVAIAADTIDITNHRRPRSPAAPPAKEVALERITATIEADDTLTRHGASDIAFTLRNTSDPILETSFYHPSRRGVRLVRREHLVTELGFPLGAGALGIFLDEDVMGGLIPPIEDADRGILYV